jgi:transposase
MSDLTAQQLADLAQDRPDLAQVMERGMAAAMSLILKLELRLHKVGDRLDDSRRVPIPNSRTSHTPPSLDPRPKPRSLRKKSGKKSGGQPGHAGHRLEPVAMPDVVINHPVTECGHCEANLKTEPVLDITPRQVFDLPQIRLEVTEHRCERKTCPSCKKITTADAPTGAGQPTQYGLRLSALAVYLSAGHFVPVARTCEIIQMVTGSRPSQGWVLECQKRVSRQLDGFLNRVKDLLRHARAVCCDETGFRFCSKRFWLHVCSTALLTFLMVSRSRGSKAIREMGILGNIRQTAVHDHYHSYFTMDCTHGMCNAHHLRELTYVHEELGQAWAKRMIRVLLDGKQLKEKYHPYGKRVPKAKIQSITRRYRRALSAGKAVNPEPPPPRRPTKGRRARSKSLNLLNRLREHEEDTLRFLTVPAVPWDNNQAERDLRMGKVQQKVSGGFRTEAGAVIFARCRSYLDTMRKQGKDVMLGIMLAMQGKAWKPPSARRAKKKLRLAA